MALALYTHPDMLGHTPPARHPESPARLAAVLAALDDSDLALDRRAAPLAAQADLALAHGEAYLDAVAAAAPREGRARLEADTWMSPGSLAAARRAAGAAIEAARAVATGQLDRAFCAVRPPGHHAGPGFAMGFCIYSNVALAARAAQQALSARAAQQELSARAAQAGGLARIAIADFDVHHGNGTQAVFEADPSVLFCSVHQSPLYPGSGAPDETGAGNIVNATVPPDAPREAWRRAFEGLVERIDAFAPDMLIVSAGFDAHARDPLAQQRLEAEDFAWATRALAAVARARCGGRMVSSLEGGYDLEGLSASALAHARALAQA
ncbi:MAG TPA: histone deacetylase family protein [Caulobacteraceae bacterium]|jgi:acetoin utilization deacetylase AcuC-like enzyme|nr:histone deacetylase family protein [Caulobacteraceae bacterium]